MARLFAVVFFCLSPCARALGQDAPVVLAEEEGVIGITASVETPATPPVVDDAPIASEPTFQVEPLRVIPRDRADAWLTLSPGLVRANHGGVWHASALYLRGFDAGEGQSFAASVEGIPLNEPSNAHGHGYLDLGLVIPESIAAVRVAQGAFRPEQGDFSVAGSAEYALGPTRRGGFGSFSVGSFRTYRVLAGWTSPSSSTPAADDADFVLVDAIRGDGFGPNRAHESVRANARFVHDLSSTTRLSIFLGNQLSRNDAAGIVREDARFLGTLPCDADAQLFCVVNPRQGGAAQRHVLGATITRGELTARLHVGTRDVRFRDDFTGEVLDARGDGAEARYRTMTFGSTGTYTHAFPEQHLALRAGWDLRHDRGVTRLVRLRRLDGVPYQTSFDSGLALSRIGGFAAGRYAHTFTRGARLEAEASLRADGFSSVIEHRGLPTTDRDGERLPFYTTESFGFAWQPRGYLAVRARSGMGAHLAVGVGARSTDAQALSDGETAPFTRIVASELGVSYASGSDHGRSLRADAIAFHTFVKDDLVFDPVAVRVSPAGETRRYGGTLSCTYEDVFGADAAHGLVGRASLGLSDARFVSAGRSPLAWTSGEPVPFVPRAAARLDLAYHGLFAAGRVRVDAGLGAAYVGAEPLPLGMQGEGYALVDAGVTAGYRHVDVSFTVENLADTRYRSMELFHTADYGGDDGLPAGNRLPTRLYAAGAPRTFMLTLRIGTPP